MEDAGVNAPGSEPADRAVTPVVTGFGVPPRPPEGRRWAPDAPNSRDVLAALAVAAGLIVAGVLLGVLWSLTTPKLDVKAVLAGSEAAFKTQAGVDVHFALLALICGVVAGALAGWLGRSSSWPLPVALAAGGVGGSLVAGQVGHLLESSQVLDQLPQNIRGQVSGVADFTLRSHGFDAALPVAALVTYLIIVALTTRYQPPVLPDAPEPDRYWSMPR
jgi:hypothetical protein